MSASVEVAPVGLSCDQVLRIAWKDAEKAYRDLSGFSIRIAAEPDGWHVDYELKDKHARGGGPCGCPAFPPGPGGPQSRSRRNGIAGASR